MITVMRDMNEVSLVWGNFRPVAHNTLFDIIIFSLFVLQDERVVWRGARALRELILKDEAAKTICYDTNIDDWLNRLIAQYPESSVVQSHCMRLVGALAFGNDRYRRKAGERGIMTCVAAALEHHSEDETVLLHVTTAITNLTHNSMENRMR